MIIPIPPEEIQTEIQQKINQSFHLRKQSKYLLECAKRAVEIATQDDEQTTMEWLEKETEEIGSGRAGTFGIPLLGDTDTPTGSSPFDRTARELSLRKTTNRTNGQDAGFRQSLPHRPEAVLTLTPRGVV